MVYDYMENMISDIKEYLKETKERDYDKLYDELWIEDTVTGNASGSYTFSTFKAEENLVGNLDLLKEALTEFGQTDINIIDFSPETMDVTIRCYLLGQALTIALEEIEKEKEGE